MPLYLIILLFTFSAFATNYNWIGGAGDAFHTSANWSPAAVPGSGDYALFCTSSFYSVVMDQNVLASVIVGGDGCYPINITITSNVDYVSSLELYMNIGLSIESSSLTIGSNLLMNNENNYITSTTTATIMTQNITVSGESSVKGSIQIEATNLLLNKGTIEVESLTVKKLDITEGSTTKVTTLTAETYSGTGLIQTNLELQPSSVISNLISIDGSVTASNAIANCFFKSVKFVNLSNVTITSDCSSTIFYHVVNGGDSVLNNVTLHKFNFSDFSLTISGVNSFIDSIIYSQEVTLDDTAIITADAIGGSFNSSGGTIYFNDAIIVGDLDSDVYFYGDNVVDIHCKRTIQTDSTSTFTSSSIIFTNPSTFYCNRTEETTLYFEDDVVIGDCIMSTTTIQFEKILTYTNTESTSVEIFNSYLTTSITSGNFIILDNSFNVTSSLSAYSFTYSLGYDLLFYGNNNSVQIDFLRVSNGIFDSIQLTNSDFFRADSPGNISIYYSFLDSVSFQFSSSFHVLQLLNSNYSNGDCHSTLNCFGEITLESDYIETVVVHEDSYLTSSGLTAQKTTNYGKIHSPSTNAFGTLVNEENGCIYVESYTNLGFENYGVIEINYSYDMYALTGSINSGIINGTGNLVVDSVTFTNNGVINSQTLFYNSLINIGPNFTILNDEVVFRGCEILFTESPVNISTVTYRQTTKCVEAIPSIQTNIIGVTLEEQQLDISATIIRIETSDLGTNSYSFNNCDISITDSTISTLQLTNETNIQIVNSEIQYLIATNCVINNELLVRTLRATNSTFNIVELVTGYLINSTFESIKNTQEAIICNNDTSSSSPFQYIIIKELINEASIIFNGYFQFENIVLGSEDHLHSFSINPGIAPTILVDCYVYDVTLNSVYTYGSTYFNGTIVSIITNYGELELLSLPGSIDSLILKSGSTLYSSDSFELSNMHIESMVTTSVNRCVISSSLYFEGDIDLTTLILLDGSTVTSSLSTDVLYVDTIVATDTTSIAVGIEVSNQCSNLVLSSKYLTTTESFNGYCTTSTITTLNNYGTYQHNGAISIVNNYGTYVVSSDCSSFMLNYGTLQLNDGIVGQSLFVGCGNGSVIRGSGIAGLSSQETDIETQVFVYVDGEIEITNNYDNDLIITANVYEDRNDILYVDYSTNNLFDTIVILDDFTPPEPTNYTVFVIEELSFTPNIKIRIYDYESNYPWTTGYTSTYAYVEYLGCPEVYNPLTKFCESCPTGYIFNEETKQCSDCPIGKVMTDGICVNCSAGTYEYSGTCIQCGEKEVSSEGSTECITCTSGTIPDSNKTNCVYCDAGTELIDNDIYYGCKPCSAGYYKSESQTSQRYCLPCEVGHYNPYKGQVSCFPCTPGFYQNLTGQSSCSKCPSGYAQNEFKSTECFMCENDEFANNEQSDCILCDAGFEEYQGSCYWCKPGTYKNDTGKYCEVCPDGTYQPYKGRTSCYECPDGKHVKNNATICVDDEMETNIPAMVAIYTIFPIAIAMACCSVFCCAFYENRKDKKKKFQAIAKIQEKHIRKTTRTKPIDD